MAFFRTVSFSEQLPAIMGNGVVLRAPQMSDYAEWATLREASRDFLSPWEPTWPADDLTRSAFRRRIKRYTEDQRGDLAYPFFIVPRFVMAGALDAIRRDYPAIAHPGSFPLSTLRYGPAFRAFTDEIQGAEMTAAVSEKLGMDLAGRPTTVTARGPFS